MNSEPGPPPSSLHEMTPALRQLFMQTHGGGGGDTVRTLQSKQSVPHVHIGDSEPGLPLSLSLQSLSEENTLVSKQKEDTGGGEVAPMKG